MFLRSNTKVLNYHEILFLKIFILLLCQGIVWKKLNYSMKVININLSSSSRIPVHLLHVWILTESYSGRNRWWTQKSFSDLKLFVVFCIIKWFIIKSAIINKRYCLYYCIAILSFHLAFFGILYCYV